MKLDRWPEIEALLDRLLDLPRQERRERLEEWTRHDPSLKDAILPLLRETESSTGPLDGSLEPLAAAVFDGEEADGADPSEGRQIGPYRVVSKIAEGGMGSVFLAERTDGEFEHRVALKLVRHGRADIVDRFRHERQILARLRHPHIATLYDGGVTDDGQPYFAMEYVDGQRITTYCDERRLSVDARVALFEDVCRAVQYAHRNLVVHRDLKPGNVFVTNDGTVKLLDFGIAKIVDAETESGLTTTHHFLTPAYAAPEQILAEPTSTATDIYALGVLLYELLTGHNPHGDPSRSAQLARAVVETDPPSASTNVNAGGAEARGADPSTVRRRLKGDLDNILQKALKKSPDERYASAEDVRADLERHRKQLPVSARPDTLGYRLSRFAQRNRIGAAALVAAFLAVAVGLIGVSWQARVARQERDRAREAAARAETVQDFLLDIFSAADPTFETGDVPTAVELAERGADRIGKAFPDQPEVRADVTGLLGTVFLRLGEYERADSLLTRALDQHRSLGDDRGVVNTLVRLGDTYQWLRRLDEAQAHLEEAMQLGTSSLGPDDDLVMNARQALGVVHYRRGDFDAAETIIREGIAHVTSVYGPECEQAIEHYSNLSTILREHGATAESVDAMQHALDISQALHPEGGIETWRAMSSLADILDDVDRLEEADSLSHIAVTGMEEEYGEDGHGELAIAYSNRAGTLRRLGRIEEAAVLGQKAIDVFVHHLGPDHPFVARAHNNLGVTFNRMDTEAAAREFEKAVSLGRVAFGPRHPTLVPFLSNYAGALESAGRLEDAAAAYREAVSIADEGGVTFGKTYAQLGLSGILRDMGKPAEAEQLNREAWETRKEIVGVGHSAEIHARISLASLFAENGRFDESRPLLDSAIEDARAGLPATREVLEKAVNERALVARDAKEPEAVRADVLRQLLELRRERLEPDDPEVTRLEEELGALTAQP